MYGMMTMNTEMQGFPAFVLFMVIVLFMGMGLRSAGLRAAGELHY